MVEAATHKKISTNFSIFSKCNAYDLSVARPSQALLGQKLLLLPWQMHNLSPQGEEIYWFGNGHMAGQASGTHRCSRIPRRQRAPINESAASLRIKRAQYPVAGEVWALRLDNLGDIRFILLKEAKDRNWWLVDCPRKIVDQIVQHLGILFDRFQKGASFTMSKCWSYTCDYRSLGLRSRASVWCPEEHNAGNGSQDIRIVIVMKLRRDYSLKECLLGLVA